LLRDLNGIIMGFDENMRGFAWNFNGMIVGL